MNRAEQDQISEGLFEVKRTLESLATEPRADSLPWPEIALRRKEAHDFFNKIIGAFLAPCEKYRENMRKDPRSFEQWRFSLADLWNRLNFMRDLYHRLFAHDYVTVLYHHLFIEELFNSLSESLAGARSKFLILPTGDLMVWSIQETLAALAPPWFQRDELKVFSSLKAESEIICFECHRDRNFSRQLVLAHEIFHIVVRNNAHLEAIFEELSENTEIQDVLQSQQRKALVSQLEELFCDFSASWYYGPIYLQAFADEISYYQVQQSKTHPPGDLRAATLLATNSSYKDLRGYQSLSQYLKLRKRAGVSLPTPQILRKHFATPFRRALEDLDLDQYQYEEIVGQISESFAHNIPYVVNDIRDFVNNLPSEIETKSPERYASLVSESIRKSNLLRQVATEVRDPDKLFAMPQAFTSPRRVSAQ